MNKSVWLIGMPGSGKSTISNHFNGLDTDNLINLKTNAHNLSANDFYDHEMKTILSFIKTMPTGCIATGGSVVHRAATMENIKSLENSIVIYLFCPLPILTNRLDDIYERGVVFPPFIHTFQELYTYRHDLYSLYADITINTGEKSIEDTLQIVNKILKSKT